MSSINEELKIMPFVAQQCRQKRWAVDGGANHGEFTAAMLEHFEAVCAIEPVNATFKRLQERYGDHDRVMLMQNALWHTSDVRLFMAHPAKRSTSTSYYATTKEKNSEHSITTVAIDDVLTEDVDFIKLDLEGAELYALMGARKIIDKYRPMILIECVQKQLDRYGHSITAVDKWLTSRGYTLRKVQGVNRLYI